MIGTGASQERAIVGETPNLAASLQGIAEPNMAVIADGTRRLLGKLFELEDLGAEDLKGIAGPVRADLAGAFLGYPGLSNDQSKGFAGGGTLAVNWQTGSLVYGLETDLSWLNNKTTYVDPNGAINPFYPSETNRLNVPRNCARAVRRSIAPYCI